MASLLKVKLLGLLALALLGRKPDATAATLSLAGLSLGFGWVYPPLGLIVPSGLVFACLAYKRLRGSGGEA